MILKTLKRLRKRFLNKEKNEYVNIWVKKSYGKVHLANENWREQELRLQSNLPSESESQLWRCAVDMDKTRQLTMTPYPLTWTAQQYLL